jgi:hypothetical protein
MRAWIFDFSIAMQEPAGQALGHIESTLRMLEYPSSQPSAYRLAGYCLTIPP